MDCASRTSLAGLEGARGLKGGLEKDLARVRREGPEDRVTSISLLTAAIGIDTVIGHALKESPTKIIEHPHLPLRWYENFEGHCVQSKNVCAVFDAAMYFTQMPEF